MACWRLVVCSSLEQMLWITSDFLVNFAIGFWICQSKLFRQHQCWWGCSFHAGDDIATQCDYVVGMFAGLDSVLFHVHILVDVDVCRQHELHVQRSWCSSQVCRCFTVALFSSSLHLFYARVLSLDSSVYLLLLLFLKLKPGWNGYVSISSSAVFRVVSLNEHADLQVKVMTVNRVTWVFRGLTAQLRVKRNSRNRIIIIRSHCLRLMKCWCGYLSEARCRFFASGPADVTASQPSPL